MFSTKRKIFTFTILLFVCVCVWTVKNIGLKNRLPSIKMILVTPSNASDPGSIPRGGHTTRSPYPLALLGQLNLPSF